jgi:hypothetical protein
MNADEPTPRTPLLPAALAGHDPSAAATQPTVHAEPCSTPRTTYVGRRFDLLDAVVPPILIGYILCVPEGATRRGRPAGLVADAAASNLSTLPGRTAYWAVCRIAAPELGRWRLPYLAAANTLLPALLYTFLSVHLLPASSAAPPREPPQAVTDKTVVFICADETGAVPRCYRDGCGGAWKPGRCRHCSICRTCQVRLMRTPSLLLGTPTPH